MEEKSRNNELWILRKKNRNHIKPKRWKSKSSFSCQRDFCPFAEFWPFNIYQESAFWGACFQDTIKFRLNRLTKTYIAEAILLTLKHIDRYAIRISWKRIINKPITFNIYQKISRLPTKIKYNLSKYGESQIFPKCFLYNYVLVTTKPLQTVFHPRRLRFNL